MNNFETMNGCFFEVLISRTHVKRIDPIAQKNKNILFVYKNQNNSVESGMFFYFFII